MATLQTANPGKYNIGQQGRVIKSLLDMPTALRAHDRADAYGFVTVHAVKEEAGLVSCDIGGVWINKEAIIF